MRWTGTGLWFVGWLWIGTLGYAQTHPAVLPFPAPDEVIRSGEHKMDSYVQTADAWLAEHADSPYAPRVLMDMLMVATAAQQPEFADSIRARLLLVYPGSLPGRYVGTSFKDAEAYGKFLDRLLEKRFKTASVGFARQFTTLMAAGTKFYGSGVLVSEPFALKVALLARDAGDSAVAGTALAKARPEVDGPTEITQIMDVCFGGPDGPVRQVQAIHALPGKTALAGEVEQYLVAKMDADQRSAPAMKRLRAELALAGRQFPEALELLESLPTDQIDARTLCLRAWGHAALRQNDKVSALAEQAMQIDRDSPWSKLAGQLVELANGSEKNLDEHSADLMPALESLERGASAVALRLEITPAESSNKAPMQIDLLMADKRFEVQCEQGGKLLLAYRTTDKQAAIYNAGESTIYQFSEGGFLPAPEFKLQERPGGGYNFNLIWKITHSGQPLKMALGELLANPILSSREGVRRLLGSNIQRGSFPIPVGGQDKKRYAWVTPRMDRPELERTEYAIGPDHRLLWVRGARAKLTVLGYGPEVIPEVAPAWPEARIIQRAKMDGGSFLRLIQSFMSLSTEAGEGSDAGDAAGQGR